ncbi:MAG TPA: DsrE family protein [Candidatus Competibacteraceae bacterium]|nr:DsrE family protein [Candidatus Competibacteraceae bacterium]MCP5134344.1 DsrE family protein [Gammaproteobacteria bacterium]HPF58891.1 DsrE family protein [Candidatus Competibacteraceae bacterium]HRY18407.1 DsrE family protein [Candidatus Competibacteraceae bacterium]
MKFMNALLLIMALAVSGLTTPVLAGDTDPLFVNMTADDAHRANMAITFGKAQMERGHPLTVFLNDKGVLVGAKANAGQYEEHQKKLIEIMQKGGVVIACPMCMKHYGIETGDLLPGIQVGKPELTGAALFKDGTQTLTW